MKRYVVVLVSFDYYRFEDYLGIYSLEGINSLFPALPILSLDESKELADEKIATQKLGNDMVHYIIEEIINE